MQNTNATAPATVIAAFNALDLSGRAYSGSLSVEQIYDPATRSNQWVLIDRVFRAVAVFSNGVAVIVANKRRSR